MSHVVLITGLPGSGKTTLAMLEFRDYVLVDDPKFGDVQFIDDYLSENLDIVIVDPNLCRAAARERAMKHFTDLGHSVQCVFFANDPLQCRINAASRVQPRPVNADIDALTRVYEIPAGADVRPVWRPE